MYEKKEGAMLLLLCRLLREAVTFCSFEKLRKGARNYNRFARERSSYTRKLACELKSEYWFVHPV
jgi:hypothetical protein